MKLSSVSVVVPCYRSEETLETLVKQLLRIGEAEAGRAFSSLEIILVVDGSPDCTEDVAQELARGSEHVLAIVLSRNYGQHNATLAGIRAATGDVIVTCDDDLQHRPDEIPRLLAAMADDVDLVYGVSEVEEHQALRSFASRGVKRSLERVGVSNASAISAFRAFRSELRNAFDLNRDPLVSLDVILSWATTRVAVVKVRMDQRTQGESNYGFRSLVRHAMNMITGYSMVPLRLSIWLGFAMAVFGISLGVFLLVKFAQGETTVAGFTTLACLIALFSSAQLISIGVIGEYLGRMHVRQMGKPQYVIKSTSSGE